jgi:hypothetical protein
MFYSQFTIAKVIEQFSLSLVETQNLLPDTLEVSLSPYLQEFITKNLQLAIALNTEKARSELVICPVLLSVKENVRNISLFSGEELNVDPSLGLNGVCDFIISQSPEQSYLKAPVVLVVEAKKEDLKAGIGQCTAEMVAALKFNNLHDNNINTVYGAVTTGTLWRFLKLHQSILTLDLNEYPLSPLENTISRLMQMVSKI